MDTTCIKALCSLDAPCRKPGVTLRTNVDKNLASIRVGTSLVSALLDTGASISCISEELVFQSFPNIKIQHSSLKSGVCGEVHKVLGQVDITIDINGLAVCHTFHVFRRLHWEIILGVDFFKTE